MNRYIVLYCGAHNISIQLEKMGIFFFQFAKYTFCKPFWGLSNDLFVEIFKPEGVVFHKDWEYTKKAIWEISAKYIDSFETAELGGLPVVRQYPGIAPESQGRCVAPYEASKV